MRAAFAGLRAVAWLTILEALRQRLWLPVLAACALLLVAVPQLRAVDHDDRLRLAVAVLTGTVGFVLVLLAVLVAAAAVRRDLDQRCSFLLFSKPLPRGAYLGGRWLGLMAVLSVTVLALGVVGLLATRLQLGELPVPRSVRAAERSWRLDNGQAQAIPETAGRVALSGSPQRGSGEGMRWRFTELPVGSDLTLLLRAGVGGYGLGNPIEQALVTLSALPDEAATDTTPRLLALADDSPYGRRVLGEGDAAPGQAVVRNRDDGRHDLARDYLRFVVPAEAIGADGAVTVQLSRLEGQSRLTFYRGSSALLALDEGDFAGDLLRACMVLLAQAGLLAACSLLVISVAQLGTTLLAGLTLYFGGNALRYVEEVLSWDEYPRWFGRLLGLLLAAMPDFQRFGVAADLAASRSIGWDGVAAAWGYYGGYAVIFLAGGWLLLRRREL